ncbi:MAG: hypothetical protein WA476_06700 [Acidobacteriaceae bacterium]
MLCLDWSLAAGRGGSKPEVFSAWRAEQAQAYNPQILEVSQEFLMINPAWIPALFYVAFCSNNWFPMPSLQRNVSFYQIIFGFILGLILQPLVTTLRILWWYWQVAGRYSVQRQPAADKVETAGGEIEITLNWWRGTHALTARHANGSIQWKGEMRLSLDMKNVGNGVYWHVDEDKGVGDQRFRYVPEKKEFRVQGTTFGAGASQPFFHLWTRK